MLTFIKIWLAKTLAEITIGLVILLLVLIVLFIINNWG